MIEMDIVARDHGGTSLQNPTRRLWEYYGQRSVDGFAESLDAFLAHAHTRSLMNQSASLTRPIASSMARARRDICLPIASLWVRPAARVA